MSSKRERGLWSRNPATSRLLASFLQLLQVSATTPQQIEVLEPQLERLQKLAPLHPRTYRLLANQAFIKGDYREVIRIVDAYQVCAPDVEFHLGELKAGALILLQQQEASPETSLAYPPCDSKSNDDIYWDKRMRP